MGSLTIIAIALAGFFIGFGIGWFIGKALSKPVTQDEDPEVRRLREEANNLSQGYDD